MLTVTPGNHAPTAIVLSSTLVEVRVSGAVVGTIDVIDLDSGDTHALTVSDSRFEAVLGQLKLIPGQHVSLADGATIDVTITATDSGTPQRSLATVFTIQVLTNPFPWQNKTDRFDSDGNGTVERTDVFQMIAEYRRAGRRALAQRPATGFGLYLDVFADNVFNTADIFSLISRLRNPPPGGEGEAEGLASAVAEGEGGEAATEAKSVLIGRTLTPVNLSVPFSDNVDRRMTAPALVDASRMANLGGGESWRHNRETACWNQFCPTLRLT